MAYKLVNPLTSVGAFVKRCWKASLRLWAGSVDMIRTEDLTWERRIPNVELHVVFPTPPFPPTNTHLRVSCSNTFFTVPWGKSSLLEAIDTYTQELIEGKQRQVETGKLILCWPADPIQKHVHSSIWPLINLGLICFNFYLLQLVKHLKKINLWDMFFEKYFLF